MEEVFEDKYRDVANKIEELEMDLEDLEYEQRTDESTEMMTEEQFDEAAGEKDACYHKVKRRTSLDFEEPEIFDFWLEHDNCCPLHH